MAIQVAGATAANVVEVDATQKAARVTLRPQEVLAWNSLSAQSGALTGLAANSPVFAYRNSGSNNVLVRRVGVGLITTTAFTTAQVVDFGLMVARSFTASDTGGTALAVAASNNGKHRTSLQGVTAADARIASTAALTAGTRTLDAVMLGQVMGWSAAAGVTIPVTPSSIFQRDDGSDYPLVLAPNEGIEIAALTAWGSTGVGRLYVQMEFAEVAVSAF